MCVIKDVDIIKPDKILNSYDIKFSDKILDIKREIQNDNDCQIIDGNGYYLSPGFIDLHMHGSFGIDIMSAGKEDLKEMIDGLTKAGTTSFLPTVMTASVKRMENAIKNIQKVMKEENNVIKGINLEGPLLNPTKAGAQDKKYMRNLNLELFDKYKEVIEIVTVAPEVEGATALLNKLNSLNIVSAMGHTNASYEESLQGFKKGISLVTHLFNGMKGIHHREIGAAGASLLENISTEIIVDGIHISRPMIQMILRLKKLDDLILITDAQPAALYEGEEIQFNNRKVILRDGSARFEDGTLAGSVLSMQKAVKNMAEFTDLNIEEIIRMATLNPARKIKIDSKIGSIEPNKNADLLLMDKKLNIINVFKKGKQMI
ncbi:MAG: N-acetylglucosamine-6-phosphate deacetylase [Halanaerobiales bacterium]|nr:N-acetylglucosamine-6-phosphate deacetylase [Halanaerobiales bacterium]